MNTQHLFLSNNKGKPSERWSEAFPAGRVVTLTDLLGGVEVLSKVSVLVWMSISEPGWNALLARVTQALPKARVIVLSGVPEPQEGLTVLNAGALGYAHAYSTPVLFQEIATVVELGGVWSGPELLKMLVSSTFAALNRASDENRVQSASAKNYAQKWATLSGREAQVARSVAAGRSNKEVADKLYISERTVKAHLGSIFDKLGLRDRLQLAVLVASVGADPDDKQGDSP